MGLFDDAYALIAPRGRSIGFIIPDVVISELHTDATGITQHPVEIGAAITDHAFLLPSRLEMRCGWSDSGAAIGFSAEAYQSLLALRATRQPFMVQTGKRLYRDMLIATLTTETDEKTENALLIAVGMQQVLMAQARGGVGGGMAAASNGDQTDPASTGGVTDAGSVQPIPAGGVVDYSGTNIGNGLSALPQGVSSAASLQPGTPSSAPTTGQFTPVF